MLSELCVAKTIVANGKDFNFRSVPERSCLLVEAPSGFEQDGVGKKVGAVTAKLQVQVGLVFTVDHCC